MNRDRERLQRQHRMDRTGLPAGDERTRTSRVRQAIVLAAMTAALVSGANDCARAQKLEARYVISMTGIRVGQSAWTVDIDTDRYAVSASGGSVDILNVLLRGEGVAQASGSIKDGRLVPANFSSNLTEDGEKVDLKMTLDEGIVTAVEDNAPPPSPDRVPLTQSHAQGVTDPLTALLIPNEGSGAVPAKESCNRTLAIFDGRRRYDLVLSFKRMEDMRDKEKEDGGRIVVCNVILRPIAGHRANSMIMKYVAGRRDMEISFAPIAGTRWLAPFRLSVPTLIGTMAVQATSFETSAQVPQARQ
jgi:uncharacterized protein DUF3108